MQRDISVSAQIKKQQEYHDKAYAFVSAALDMETLPTSMPKSRHQIISLYEQGIQEMK